MRENGLMVLAIILFLIGVLTYRWNYLRIKKLWYFTWQQIYILVIIPGVVFPLTFSYLFSVTARPDNSWGMISDKVLITGIVLALMFTYGGLAIHSVTKMLADLGLRTEKSLAAEVNRYYHLVFSHNLTFGGVLVVMVGLVLLETNHAPSLEPVGVGGAIIKGLLLGLCLLAAMYFYTRSKDDYAGRWADLKWVFGLMWAGVSLLVYGIKRANLGLTDYQLLLPSLVGLGLLALLNAVLVVRRVRRGWRVYISQKRLRRLLYFWEGEE